MRSNPLVTEVLAGLSRPGKAQLDHLGLVVLQAGVLFVLWPKGGVDELLTAQHSPYTLAGVVMAMGLAMAYIALRAGAEECLLTGQHGLRDWTLATPLGLGRILRGYLAAQVVHSVYLLVLSAPLVAMAFTVSGGEWPALGWCVAGALVQAMFYRLCGAITHLTIGQYEVQSHFTVRAVLVTIYVVIGWFAPVTSHLALAFHALNGGSATQSAYPSGNAAAFLAIYAGLSVAQALAVYLLLLRDRRRTADRAGFEEAAT